MPKRKHNFNDGDIVTDIPNKEVFYFKHRRDGHKAENEPSTLRHANLEETLRLQESNNSFIKLT